MLAVLSSAKVQVGLYPTIPPPRSYPNTWSARDLDSPSRPGLWRVQRPYLPGRNQLAEGRWEAHLEWTLLLFLLFFWGAGSTLDTELLFSNRDPMGRIECGGQGKGKGKEMSISPSHASGNPEPQALRLTWGWLYDWGLAALWALTRPWGCLCFCAQEQPVSGGPTGARCSSCPSLSPGGTAPGKTRGRGGGA